jgi:hypothetical protein
MINPDLDFSLPSFDVPYCTGSGVFTIPITNHGDGTAYSGTLAVNLSPFSVDVTPPASYSGQAPSTCRPSRPARPTTWSSP